jgi:cytochrome c
MPTQYPNYRDTPLRRFNAFWWGLAYFAIFGAVSALVYWQTGKPVDAVAEARAAGRLEIKAKVDADQSKMLPSEGELEKMGEVIKGEPQASGQKAAGPAPVAKKLPDSPGLKLYTAKQCHTCHGADANSPIMPAYPKLGGQNAEYLLAQIKDIHSGARANGQSASMKALTTAMNLSEEEMKTISDWIAGLEKPAVELAEGDGKNLYVAKACATCHGMDANTPIMPVYPRLAGQNSQYLYDQMKAIKDGTRTNGQSAAMKPMMMNVSEEEMKIIADWIAGQK